MVCTACGAANAEDAGACAGCQRPMAEATPDEARCKRHPGVPAAAACARCGTFACRECLERGVCVACRDPRPLPWDERRARGLLQGWWRTTWGLLRAPRLTLERAWPQASVGSSLTFAFVASLVGQWTSVPWLLLNAYSIASLPNAHFPWTWALMTEALKVSEPVLALLPLAMVDHWLLKLVGARPRPYQVTLRAGALSLAPIALCAVVPCNPPWLTLPWAFALRVMALHTFHLTSWRQALMAVFPSSLLLLWGEVVTFSELARRLGAIPGLP